MSFLFLAILIIERFLTFIFSGKDENDFEK